MKMCVHDIADGLVGNPLYLFDEGTGRRRLRMGVHHQYSIAHQNDRGVAVKLICGLGDCGVYAVSDGLDLEKLLRGSADCA